MTETPTQTVQHLDPRTLLVDLNVRHDTRLTADFVDSIREQGVLQPVVAVRTVDGAHRVRYGHRRTLAAIESGRETVPVLVAADESSDDAGQVERLVSQYAENEHRTGLSTGERVDVMAQLAAFGVPAAQIAKRTKAKRAEVDAALTVAGSRLAKAATERYDFLDLEQAAVVAEFEDQPDAVKVLVTAASTGQFAHAAQRLRDERAQAAAQAEVAAALAAAGVSVVERPAYGTSSPAKRLDSLTHDHQRLDADSHAQCPGHAAFVTSEWIYPDAAADAEDLDPERDDEQDNEDERPEGGGSGRPQPYRGWATVYVCTDPAAHGHADRYGLPAATTRPKMADLDPEQAEAARAARRDVIESNKAWASAETVRLAWLRTFLARKTAPKGSATFTATALASDGEVAASIGGNHLAAGLLGCEASSYGRSSAVAALVARAGEPRASVLTLALVLAGYEDAMTKDSWRHVSAGTARYLRFLEANGYALADVERRACGEDSLAR